MKDQADKHRVERVFAVGDQVYLKLQPYVQTSIARRSNQKLGYKYFGPYTIIQRVGAVAYKLDVPRFCQIHPVVHVSLLKKTLPANTSTQPDLPLAYTAVDSGIVPLCSLDTKWVQAGTKPQELVYIQWSSLPEAWCTWENKQSLLKLFPNAHVWGQAGNQDRGNVMEVVPEAQPKVTTTTQQGE